MDKETEVQEVQTAETEATETATQEINVDDIVKTMKPKFKP